MRAEDGSGPSGPTRGGNGATDRRAARGGNAAPAGRNGGGGCGNGAGTCGCGGSEAAAGAGGPTRRDFLKVLGVTGAGAATFGCRAPDFSDKLVPYLVQHEELVPGTNTVYASALFEQGPEPLAIHAWVREGRPIKLEGNPDFGPNAGRLSALGQSALQDLYDPDRVPNPLRAAGEAGEEEPEDPRDRFEDATWEDALAAAVSAVAGDGVVLLTGPGTGTSDRFFQAWAEAMGAEHVRWESFDLALLREAHRIAFGRPEIPRYRLEEADRIVCFGADFLGSWLAPVELAAGFARARDIERGRHAKFTFVGPRLNLSGANADEWIEARPGTEGLVALAVAGVVAGARGAADLAGVGGQTPESAAEAAGVPAEAIRRLGEEIAEAGSPVALPPGPEAQGPNALDAHLAVAILNSVSGAVGATVTFGSNPLRGASATYREMTSLVERMRGGQVRTLLVVGANPAFTLPAASGFREALGGVGNVIAITPHLHETAALAGWVLPAHHALESWGDAEVRPGEWLLGQPVIRPLFDTRAREDILMELASATGAGADFGAQEFADYLRDRWREMHAGGAGGAFDDWWHEALRRGGAAGLPTRGPAGGGAAGGAAGAQQAAGAAPAAALSAEARGHAFQAAAPGEGRALVVYPTTQFYDGRGANRSWMQELPDPVTYNVWNSWVELHPDTAAELDVEHGDVVEVRSEAGAVRAPAYLYRGIRRDAVGIPIGQGHWAYGRYARGRGVNPLDLLPPRTVDPVGALAFAGVSVEVEATGERDPLVNSLGSDSDYGRHISGILDVEEARHEIEAHEIDLGDLVHLAYDSDPNSPYRWGMTIDLNACTGCGACVTACYAENNIPTVGEELFAQGREMAWLRVERYFHETEEGGRAAVHVPMLCQHCGDAPCEPVCPVYATYHNPEGLNAQVYNRCVGTRYCSNNCPYKVRRFNWFTYEFPYPLNLQLNPDITVREKGVMEKCSFCVQRINHAKLQAKEEGRAVRDGEIVTACQQTCPADAIVFGNLKEPGSDVSRLAKSARAYGALAELGTRPAVQYLDAVTHAHLAGQEHEGLETPILDEGAEEGEA